MSSGASLRKMTLCGVGEGRRDARPRQRKVVKRPSEDKGEVPECRSKGQSNLKNMKINYT